MPFFIRPISSIIADRIFAAFIFPNARKNLAFLEQQLATSSGAYLCGDSLTAADILMSFPLIAAQGRLDTMGSWEGGSWDKANPLVKKYLARLEAEPGYKRSVAKVEAIDGKFEAAL